MRIRRSFMVKKFKRTFVLNREGGKPINEIGGSKKAIPPESNGKMGLKK